MATITKGKTFTDGELVTPAKLHQLVDSAQLSPIVNADIAAGAAIADTKLATISTVGKVANSATTATNANTASAIVARDASGNFSANTITANLTGNATNVTGTVAVANGGTGATTAAAARTSLGLGNSATLNTGTTSGTVATGDHTHTQLHNRSHAITSTSDHTAGNWKVFHSNGSGQITELDLGSANTVLTSNGPAVAPTWQTLSATSTNANNLTGGAAGTVPYQSAAGTTAMLAAGTSGQVLRSNGAAAPSWLSLAASATTDTTNAANIASGTLDIARIPTGTGSTQVALGNHTHSAATTSAAGFLSTADKTKLDAATNANTGNAIVARDASGNFSAGTITANLTGNVTGSAATWATARSLSLTGEVTATLSSVNGSADVSAAATIANAAVTTAKLAPATQQSLVPAGAVMPFAMNSAPSGWLAANGDAVSRSTYAALFSAIGTAHGTGDGSTTFNLPDLRGIFVRGSGSQTVSGTAYSGTFAGKQGDAVNSGGDLFRRSSNHWGAGGGVVGLTMLYSGDNVPAYGTSSSYFGGTETRPANIALLYCIKF